MKKNEENRKEILDAEREEKRERFNSFRNFVFGRKAKKKDPVYEEMENEKRLSQL